jgi:hypothetical protein
MKMYEVLSIALKKVVLPVLVVVAVLVPYRRYDNLSKIIYYVLLYY